MTDLMRNALTLINQLTEDNTKLANLILEKDVIILEQGKFVEENERLKTELRKTAQKLKAVEEVNDKLTADVEWAQRRIIDTDKKVARLREEIADTIKQFADRLKRYYDENEKYLGYSIAYNIDLIVKEMEEGVCDT
jgi:adenylate kinase family enzyme